MSFVSSAPQKSRIKDLCTKREKKLASLRSCGKSNSEMGQPKSIRWCLNKESGSIQLYPGRSRHRSLVWRHAVKVVLSSLLLPPCHQIVASPPHFIFVSQCAHQQHLARPCGQGRKAATNHPLSPPFQQERIDNSLAASSRLL